MKPTTKYFSLCDGFSPKFKTKSKLKKHVNKTAGKIVKRTLSSKKNQKNIYNFFSSQIEKTYNVKSHSSLKKSRKCLFNDATPGKKVENKNAVNKSSEFIDETSSSSFIYSPNPQCYIDVDIAGHNSRLDISYPLEVVSVGGEHQFSPISTKKQAAANDSEKDSRGKKSKSDDYSVKNYTKMLEAVVKEVPLHEMVGNKVDRSEGFYRFIEGDADERKENIEYDLDDQVSFN